MKRAFVFLHHLGAIQLLGCLQQIGPAEWRRRHRQSVAQTQPFFPTVAMRDQAVHKDSNR